jgi:hypothetical protein
MTHRIALRARLSAVLDPLRMEPPESSNVACGNLELRPCIFEPHTRIIFCCGWSGCSCFRGQLHRFVEAYDGQDLRDGLWCWLSLR